jgi:hypothetical protein
MWYANATLHMDTSQQRTTNDRGCPCPSMFYMTNDHGCPYSHHDTHMRPASACLCDFAEFASSALACVVRPRPCLVPEKFYKIFQILRHIESLDVCMEYQI